MMMFDSGCITKCVLSPFVDDFFDIEEYTSIVQVPGNVQNKDGTWPVISIESTHRAKCKIIIGPQIQMVLPVCVVPSLTRDIVDYGYFSDQLYEQFGILNAIVGARREICFFLDDDCQYKGDTVFVPFKLKLNNKFEIRSPFHEKGSALKIEYLIPREKSIIEDSPLKGNLITDNKTTQAMDLRTVQKLSKFGRRRARKRGQVTSE